MSNDRITAAVILAMIIVVVSLVATAVVVHRKREDIHDHLRRFAEQCVEDHGVPMKFAGDPYCVHGRDR